MNKRSAGVLLNISELPSEFGIGGFGDEAIDFAKWLKYVGFGKWQILPLTCLGMGDSPYCGHSAFAGNALYIAPKKLLNCGFIDENTMRETMYNGSAHTIDYSFVNKAKRGLVANVVDKLINDDKIKDYAIKQKYWLHDYAAYMSIKDYYNGAPWYEWESDLREHDEITIKNFIETHRREYNYYVVEQYLFDTQWQSVKSEINSIGIEIIGDMPIYVSLDSSDVWAHREIFELDDNGKPSKVAGVPPDYFSATGQLWGNPIYNYQAMAIDGYRWFVERGKRMAELYNTVRLDHFRAFDKFWAVPYGSPDAIDGEWIKADGLQLLTRVMKANPQLNLIAEDLGIIDEGVIKLRNDLGLAGMHVMQFGFDDPNSTNAPHNYLRHSVAYTGTHDNNTIFGWLYELAPEKRQNVYEYVGAPEGLEGGAGSRQVYSIIRTLMTSAADTVIVPFQDLSGWGNDTRINVPGVADGNWRIRITYNDINSIDAQKFRNIIELSGRS